MEIEQTAPEVKGLLKQAGFLPKSAIFKAPVVGLYSLIGNTKKDVLLLLRYVQYQRSLKL